MSRTCACVCGFWATVVLLASGAVRGEVFPVPLRNPSFAEGRTDDSTQPAAGLVAPAGWSRYGGAGRDLQLRVVEVSGGRTALLIADGDPGTGIGVVQRVELRRSETYEVSAEVQAVEGVSTEGAHLQLRFLPSNEFVQTALRAPSSSPFSRVAVRGTAPPDTTGAVIYLYTHGDPQPQLLVTNVQLAGGLPPPPPPLPPPIPPQYERLKDLHQDISLVSGGQPQAAIVAPASGCYEQAALGIQAAIEKQTGVQLPIISDQAPQAAVPLQGNLIVLGNRSTNRTICALYDQHYCLVDRKYPGPDGYVLRSVHNPFGTGHGLMLVGGSDPRGVDAGAEALAGILAGAEVAAGELSIGWTMQTRLGKGIQPPRDLEAFEIWDASKGYGSVGYFGWCSISKRMAMYYMTGDEFSAREFVRLAFPDEQARREIARVDGERVENKTDPLAGFYHYNAHMAILLWDLIEESPVFTDEERLRITNAFARQLNHRRGEGVYNLTQPPAQVGTRHGQWSALSLYCLGRYFSKDYPDPVWAQCVRAGELAFHSLHEHAWLAGESDNLFWYNTGIAPVLNYMVLTGDRRPLENGVLDELLWGQEILISGRVPDWALNSASLTLLNQAAYLTGDGRWLTYRDRTGVDTGVFRLGQSFWPDEALEAELPDDLVGCWSVQRLTEPAWSRRASGLAYDRSFYFASYRSAPDAGGDYILLDGFNGASRNPYHTFDILELRLNGRTVLQGYHNQVQTSADGMVEPAVAMDAAMVSSNVLGPTASAVGEVPAAAFCNWRRTLAQRTGRYALVVDDLTFRTGSRNMKIATTWQTLGGAWNAAAQAIRLGAAGAASAGVEIRSCDVQEVRSAGGVVTMNFRGAVEEGGQRTAFTLIAPTPDSPAGLACTRVADGAAALALPHLALGVVGEHGSVQGRLVVLAEDHLYGQGLTGGVLVTSDAPLDLDWDFARGELYAVTTGSTRLVLSLAKPLELRLDGQRTEVVPEAGRHAVLLPPGRHLLTGASPAPGDLADVLTMLERSQAEGRKRREEALAAAAADVRPSVPQLPVVMTAELGGPVAEMIQAPAGSGPQLCIAQGSTVHVLSADGQEIRRLQTEGPIRTLAWWDEHRLLLAGCTDEQVIAFDERGRRTWSFTSQMDPAVFAAAKDYWFKSARGHEGIHGLYTGRFDQGKSRCFVGSACTLEILDEHGQLVQRTPVFWGPGRTFQILDAADGSRDLLVARWPNGNDTVAIVNSKALKETGRGFYSVPSGHALVGGWSAQNRTALCSADLDGDGSREVITAINGTWNRVTVYSAEGRPLSNAQFGPGASTAPRAQMRGLDLADLNADGRPEIVVGIAEGLVVALDGQCGKQWSTRLASPPVSLRCAALPGEKLPWIIVGCEDGSVWALDAEGEIVRRGQVTGRPKHLQILPTAAAPIAILATDQGQVVGLELRE